MQENNLVKKQKFYDNFGNIYGDLGDLNLRNSVKFLLNEQQRDTLVEAFVKHFLHFDHENFLHETVANIFFEHGYVKNHKYYLFQCKEDSLCQNLLIESPQKEFLYYQSYSNMTKRYTNLNSFHDLIVDETIDYFNFKFNNFIKTNPFIFIENEKNYFVDLLNKYKKDMIRNVDFISYSLLSNTIEKKINDIKDNLDSQIINFVKKDNKYIVWQTKFKELVNNYYAFLKENNYTEKDKSIAFEKWAKNKSIKDLNILSVFINNKLLIQDLITADDISNFINKKKIKPFYIDFNEYKLNNSDLLDKKIINLLKFLNEIKLNKKIIIFNDIYRKDFTLDQYGRVIGEYYATFISTIYDMYHQKNTSMLVVYSTESDEAKRLSSKNKDKIFGIEVKEMNFKSMNIDLLKYTFLMLEKIKNKHKFDFYDPMWISKLK